MWSYIAIGGKSGGYCYFLHQRCSFRLCFIHRVCQEPVLSRVTQIENCTGRVFGFITLNDMIHSHDDDKEYFPQGQGGDDTGAPVFDGAPGKSDDSVQSVKSPNSVNSAERMVVINRESGLHMRPAMKFVECAGRFSSDIAVSKGQQVVDGKSIMQITMLAATKGTKLKITATGPDAQQAVEELAVIMEAESD